jgi:hypothetical protein
LSHDWSQVAATNSSEPSQREDDLTIDNTASAVRSKKAAAGTRRLFYWPEAAGRYE